MLYTIPGVKVARTLEGVSMRNINTKIIEENYDDVLRIAYSIKAGYVSADTVMSRLGSYSRQNSIAKALKEMGRIEKSIFIFFGKSGNLREKDLQEQLQRASCLNILLNAIVIWNTVYLTRAIEHKRNTGVPPTFAPKVTIRNKIC